ncbi:MAG: hypothetical protein JWN32_657 [Solirubrobacterales bacterium]|nr:hypothetical protein [Solirubrobacterales bacterium]
MAGTALIVQWPGVTIVSSQVALHEGARGAALHARGLFRIDVTPREDTMAIMVRSLAPVPLRTLPPEPPERALTEGGPWERLTGSPGGRHDVRFDLGEDLEVRAVLATTKDPERGVTLVTAQALVTPMPPRSE